MLAHTTVQLGPVPRGSPCWHIYPVTFNPRASKILWGSFSMSVWAIVCISKFNLREGAEQNYISMNRIWFYSWEPTRVCHFLLYLSSSFSRLRSFIDWKVGLVGKDEHCEALFLSNQYFPNSEFKGQYFLFS